MPRYRQLPELYLRGSLANLTMANLTEKEQVEADIVVSRLMKHQALAADKNEFIHQLSVTIAGDYHDNRESAEQEFRIAVWRGVVQLLYHCDYTFYCSNCKKDHYTTQRGTRSIINRQFPVCPNCSHCEVSDPGDSELRLGEAIDYKNIQEIIKECERDNINPPRHKSCIIANKGEPKVKEPEKVLEDPEQIAKWFGEFVWNYFRQIIKENKIITHGKEKVTIAGPADEVAVESVLSLLRDHKIKYNFCRGIMPENGKFRIDFPVNSTPPEVTAQYCTLMGHLRKHGVRFSHDSHNVVIDCLYDAPTIEAPISRSENVVVANNFPQDEGEDLMNLVTYKSREINSESDVERADLFSKIREDLTEPARPVFDILTQSGDLYIQFSNEYGTAMPKQIHMARFLDYSIRQVQSVMTEIRIKLLEYVPGLLENKGYGNFVNSFD